MNYPLINTILLLSLLFISMVLAIWVFLKSPSWLGPNQHFRLSRLERGMDNIERRQNALEHNHDIQFRGVIESIDSLREEMHKVFAQAIEMNEIRYKVEELERRKTDTEQAMQGFRDVGCGFTGCPHAKVVVKE